MQASRPTGLCTVFVRHTSASLLIQENADPAVLADLEHWLAKWVVDGDPVFTHRAEGPDDMAAHIRSALTQTSISVPYANHQLMLGTWQGFICGSTVTPRIPANSPFTSPSKISSPSGWRVAKRAKKPRGKTRSADRQLKPLD